MKRIAVTGSRNWIDVRAIVRALQACADEYGPFILVHGGCPTGADAIAHEWALSRGYKIEVFEADWNKYGKRAGPVRNAEMAASKPDLCIAFPLDGPGTKDCIRVMRARSVRTHVFGA